MPEVLNKALVINVKENSIPSGIEGKWNDFPSMKMFTRDIKFDGVKIDPESINRVVSGMPSVFSRANLFKLAMEYDNGELSDSGGLMKFYGHLIDEWRGLIACICLEPNNISIKRIQLAYSDGNDITETRNPYEPKGAFGNLLFDRDILWSKQNLSDNDPGKRTPFIDVILYKNQVVGATSPETLLFTSISCRIENHTSPFIRGTKLTDPLKSDISPDQVRTLYGYIQHLEKGIPSFIDYYKNLEPKDLRPQADLLLKTLARWKNELIQLASEKRIDLENAGTTSLEKFLEPFSKVFNHSDDYYGVEGKISQQNDLGPDAISFNTEELLLPVESEITSFHFGNKAAQDKSFISSQPVHVLRAQVVNNPSLFHYFALPLSIKGLNVFGDTIDDLLTNSHSNTTSNITATYDPDLMKDNLEVSLRIVSQTGDQLPPIKRTYTVSKSIVLGEDILIWPDFISKQWGRYFMYSEIPHNQSTTSATPFLMDVEDIHNRSLTDKDGNPVLATSLPEEFKDISTTLHILSDNRVAGNKYQYEIYESSVPFKGLQFKSSGKNSGFVLIRYTNDQQDLKLPSNLIQRHNILQKADLGIDFGSTNTAIAYYSDKTSETGDILKFKNRRISLLGDDNKDNSVEVACENEIFFFQNNEINSNEIKSILTLHDQLRIPPLGPEATLDKVMSKAVVGGFANYERNLPINSATDNRYNLLYPNSGPVDVVYDMKWAKDPIEQSHKSAFISSILLQVYAELFMKEHVPVRLKWSLPSAMGNNIRNSYNDLWGEFKTVNPIIGNQHQVLDIGKIRLKDTLGDAWNLSVTPDPKPPGNPWPGVGGGQEPIWPNPGGGQTPPTPKKDIAVPTGSKEYKFKAIDPDACLTESTAVANYWASNAGVNKGDNFLTLSFDIGGSTSDISAIIESNSEFYLIKQHSIKFAAKLISSAIKHSKNFEQVLLTTCQRHNIFIQGLNVEPKKYSKDTAAYYFEQIVDRLNSAELEEFYTLLAAQCPELMSVNLYVTGLITYYAGQLAAKMIEEVRESNEPGLVQDNNWRPVLQVVFAGKGARIFDWFDSISKQDANQYYFDLLVAGFGGMENAGKLLADYPKFNSPESQAKDSEIKCEVAKGLAVRTQKLNVPSNNVATEIIGEDGYIFRNSNGQVVELSANSEITAEMIEKIGGQLQPAQGASCPRFMEFCQIFHKTATKFFNFNMTPNEFMEALSSMNMASYIRSLPEYRKAQEDGEFDFVSPIIILEGMKFYESNLIKAVSTQI